MAEIIEEQDLGAVIASELRQARGYDDSENSGKRARAIEYMRGEMTDVPARPNGSVQTDRTCSDTVSWILPGIVRVFTASEQMAQYDKVREENDEWSRDATEYVNYSFFRESEGYTVLYNATRDALVFGNGLASAYWEPERAETKIFRNKTEMEIATLLEEGWQPTGIVKPGKPRLELIDDPMTGDAVEAELPTLTVKLQRIERKGKICAKTCKPENLLINSLATTIEEARFVAYLHDDVTRSDLMEMADDYGWDKTVIENLPRFNRVTDNETALARDPNRNANADSPIKSGDPIGLYECYIRADKDGDGVAELIQGWWAGDIGNGQLLSDDEWEEDVPYTDIPCYPVPHSFVAESVFDRTEDIQRVSTVLIRGLLDNTYAVALPMREAEANSVLNPDILASPKFGGTIWRKSGSMASAPIIDHVIPFVGDKLLLGLQHMGEMVAKRTGVSRTTMALDPEALQNQTATASQQQRDAGYSQIELIARNMAEKGWTKYFAKWLKLAIKHGLVAQIPTKNPEAPDPNNPEAKPSGFRQIDASKWDPNMAVAINTGLGTGSRDRDMAMLNNILNGQVGMADRLAAGGLTGKALEFVPKIRKAAVQMAEASGLKNPEEYYPEITDEEVAQFKQAAEERAKQPPLEVQIKQMEVEAQGQLEGQKVQAQGQLEQMKIAANGEAEKMKAQGNAVKERAQLEADLMTKEADRQNELILEEKRQVIEREKIASAERIALAKLQQERELAIMQMSVTEVEEGGDTDEKGKAKPRTKRKHLEGMVMPPRDEVTSAFAAMAQAVMEMAQRMERSNMADLQIIRGPDGKAIGARKVPKTLN